MKLGQSMSGLFSSKNEEGTDAQSNNNGEDSAANNNTTTNNARNEGSDSEDD
jgi:hypothetical protein